MKQRTMTKAAAQRLPDWKERLERIVFLRVRSKEWNAAWKGLAALSGDDDFVALNPRSGEVWQYMGSVERGAWRHEFRHRDHPSDNQRHLLRVLATAAWKPENEKRKLRLLH
jgi:hypothetical protein